MIRPIVASLLLPLTAPSQRTFDVIPLPELGTDYRVSVAAGDLDGDAIADLVIARNRTLSIRRGLAKRPSLRFEAIDHRITPAGQGTFGVSCESNGQPCLADIDHDGDLDIVSLDAAENGDLRPRAVWRANDGTGKFAAPQHLPTPGGGELIVNYSANSIDVADWDGDGQLDLIVASRHVDIYQGTEQGFADKPTSLGLRGRSAKTCDWDGDGDLDLLMITDGQVVFCERRDGKLRPHRTLTDLQGDSGQCWLTVCDWDTDGRLDLILSETTVTKREPPEATTEEKRTGDRREREARNGNDGVKPPARTSTLRVLRQR